MPYDPQTGKYEFDYEIKRKQRKEKIKKLALHAAIPIMAFAGAYFGSELSLKRSTIEVNLHTRDGDVRKLKPIQ